MKRNIRLKQIAAWTVCAIFLAGLFIARLGIWTGPILSAWLVGTQRLRRGFAWLLATSAVFGLPHLVREIVQSGAAHAFAYVGWAIATTLVGILPFLFYRMVAARLPGFVATLALPFGGVVAAVAGTSLLLAVAPVHARTLGQPASIFLTYWFAAALLWAWNLEFRVRRMALKATLFCIAFAASIALSLWNPIPGLATGFVWICATGITVLGVWTLITARAHHEWNCRPETLRMLESPATRAALSLLNEQGRQELVSPANERFPIRNGMADLRRTEDLTGLNQKYNHLYQTIGGFYDDIQRVVCALQGFDRTEYVMSYLGLLEVKPGDAVLETSVGTGLNFKYLPRGTHLVGLDLSTEMLVNCRTNLQRWQMQADLFLGNAESLPFADESFDVVFHVGGINFFNDRAKAIREMIRVAKPGSKILIADETEEHVKATYERGAFTRGYYKNRQQPVAPPIDMVPPEMLETHLEILNVVGKNRFFALTFRKPAPNRPIRDTEPDQNKSGMEWNAIRVGAAL